MAVDIRALLIKAVRMIDTSSQASCCCCSPLLGWEKDLIPKGNWNYRIATLKDTDITTNF